MTPATRAALERLEHHHRALGTRSLRQLFADDPDRFRRLSLTLGDLTLDLSKNRVTDETLALLVALAQAAGVEARRDRMFAGEAINETESRAVGHVALRAPRDVPFVVGGEDQAPLVADVLSRMRDFAAGVQSGAIRSGAGLPFTDVVNIGIGGSDLGPAMAVAALRPFHVRGLRVHFVSNVDGAHVHDTLDGLDPRSTLVVVASKTFTTTETMTNAESARRWLSRVIDEEAVGGSLAAVSTALDRTAAFGIAPERVFGFWDWVGGRYSVWSAIGLPLMLAVGAENFDAFLRGGYLMDRHFREAPLDRNMPALLALLGVWHRNVCGYTTHAVLPYDQRLQRFPAHLQQLDMESNGKRVTLGGAPVDTATGPVIWGEPGTNGQHAFFQLLHQGTDVVPADFLLAAQPHERLSDHHAKLIANCLAQTEALAFGRTEAEAREELAREGKDIAAIDRLAPHKTFPGDRPTSTLLYRTLDPETLGMLLALYEHKVFVQGVIWDVNSFDQWGVELGKALANRLLPVVKGDAIPPALDASTRGLVERIRALGGPEP